MSVEARVRRAAYRKGYKYQLAKDHSVRVDIKPASDIATEFIDLNYKGILTIRSGYAWDGPSGPAFDTDTFMRASLVHDALYQLLRAGLLPSGYRETADQTMHRICLEDGMWSARAWWCLRGVRRLAGGAASESAKKPIIFAPS